MQATAVSFMPCYLRHRTRLCLSYGATCWRCGAFCLTREGPRMQARCSAALAACALQPFRTCRQVTCCCFLLMHCPCLAAGGDQQEPTGAARAPSDSWLCGMHTGGLWLRTLGAMLQHMLATGAARSFVRFQGAFPSPCGQCDAALGVREMVHLSRSIKEWRARIAGTAGSAFQLLCSAWLNVMMACGPTSSAMVLAILKDIMHLIGGCFPPLLSCSSSVLADSQIRLEEHSFSASPSAMALCSAGGSPLALPHCS